MEWFQEKTVTAAQSVVTTMKNKINTVITSQWVCRWFAKKRNIFSIFSRITAQDLCLMFSREFTAMLCFQVGKYCSLITEQYQHSTIMLSSLNLINKIGLFKLPIVKPNSIHIIQTMHFIFLSGQIFFFFF